MVEKIRHFYYMVDFRIPTYLCKTNTLTQPVLYIYHKAQNFGGIKL